MDRDNQIGEKARRMYNGKYTYRDYLTWTEDRWELISGKAYGMVPAPSRQHQRVLGDLFTIFNLYLKESDCEPYIAPFDVRLPNDCEQKDEDISNVVQPDLVVVCDSSKLDERGCKGVPDLVVEVLSSATAQKDLKEKLFLYESKGIQEYWVIHPLDQILMVFKPEGQGEYGKPQIYGKEDIVKAGILKNLEIELAQVFKDDQ